MKHPLTALVAAILLAVCSWVLAQGTAPTAAPTGTQLNAKSEKFTLVVPQGWQYRMYDELEEAPNAKLVVQGGVMKALGEDAEVTDNINFWWAPTGEAMWFLSGIASFHRVVIPEDTDTNALLGRFEQGGLPEGIEVRPQQLGQYVGLLGGGVPRQGFYVAAAIIVQRKSIYMAIIMGPQQAIPPQWNNFAQLIASLKAKDLQPQKIEDFLAGKPLPPLPVEEEAKGDGEEPKAEEPKAEEPKAEEPKAEE